MQPGHEKPPGAASGVERRLSLLDEPPEVVDLRAVGVELRPPFGHETVVPCLRRAHDCSLVVVSRSLGSRTALPAKNPLSRYERGTYTSAIIAPAGHAVNVDEAPYHPTVVREADLNETV